LNSLILYESNQENIKSQQVAMAYRGGWHSDI